MRLIKAVILADILFAYVFCEGDNETEIDRHLSECRKIQGASNNKRKRTQYANSIAEVINTTLHTKKHVINREELEWPSFCPVNKKPHKTDRAAVALIVLTKYLKILKEKEEKSQRSFVFSSCSDSKTPMSSLLENKENPICYALSTLKMSDPGVNVTLDSGIVANVDVTGSLAMFKDFALCLSKNENLGNCAELVFKGCKSKKQKKSQKQKKDRKRKRKCRKKRKERRRRRKRRRMRLA